MKKIVLLIVVFTFFLVGCDSGGSMKYDKELVKKDSLAYLEKKYGGNYEFSNTVSPGGSNFVDASFKDLDRSDEKGSMFITVTWYEDGGAKSDSERYYKKEMEYNEDSVKKEALKHLESKYGEKFEYKWCMAYVDYVDVTFDVLDDTKQNTVTVKWYEDGTMTDNYEK